MSNFEAVLFDADGVSILAPGPFSYHYAEQQGLPRDSIEPFFGGDFQLALSGEADLKDLIVKNNNLWHWESDPQELLDLWFEYENCPNTELAELIRKYREEIPVYLATNQERHRAKYLREVMFAGVFTDVLASAEVGYRKKQPEFWQVALAKIALKVPDITPSEIAYFDDEQKIVDVARSVGINAHLYEGIEQVKRILG
jgi:HAD superfamily hydrolase (TIGR01509 family)